MKNFLLIKEAKINLCRKLLEKSLQNLMNPKYKFEQTNKSKKILGVELVGINKLTLIKKKDIFCSLILGNLYEINYYYQISLFTSELKNLLALNYYKNKITQLSPPTFCSQTVLKIALKFIKLFL